MGCKSFGIDICQIQNAFTAKTDAAVHAANTAISDAKAETELTQGVKTSLARENIKRIQLQDVVAATRSDVASMASFIPMTNNGKGMNLVFIGLAISAVIFFFQLRR